MTPAATTPLLAGADVKVDGTALDPTAVAQVLEIRVDQHLRLPERCSIRLADPELDLIDGGTFTLGATLDVSFTGPAGSSPASVFSGEIASLEPEFDHHEAVLVVRGYDRSHRLHRTRKTAAYQQMSYSAIAQRVAGANGLTGSVQSTGAAPAFVQQSNETDWEFLWRLADEVGYDVRVDGRKLEFRPAGTIAAGGAPVTVTWGATLLAFRPRATAVQQVESVTVRGWDPATKQPIEATKTPAPSGADIGLERATAASALGGGTAVVADRPIRTSGEANALAASVADRLGETFVEAEGTAVGDPALKAGAKVEVEGVGSSFGGTYTLSAATHLLRSGRGYETRFAVTGRAGRSMLDLASPAPARPWRHGVVVGIVTNNSDPDALGRVRVRYPVLGADHEGWWARIAAPAAGTRRGVLMMPQPGDEVLLGFEHDDEAHPYVLGSVWNGTAKPQELVHTDGSFALRSDKQVLLEAAEPMTFTTDKEAKLTSAGHATITTNERSGQGGPGNVTLDAKGEAAIKSGTATKVQAGTQAGVQAGTELKLTAGTQVTIQGGGAIAIKGASLQIQSAGVVQISGAQVLLG